MLDSKQTVLITGANGFVGSRLCRRLLADGYHVIAGIRRSANRELIASLNLEIRYGDITQPETLSAMVAGADYVIHNAGIVKAKDKSDFFRVNEKGTENLFEAVVTGNSGSGKIKRVIYISSLAAAGPSTPGHPVSEDDVPKPVTTYGRSKIAGEKIALSYSDKLSVITIRPSGIYGPGDKEIFAMFQAVHYHLKPLIGTGKQKSQLVHVDDLCRGISNALTVDTKSGSIYFIAENRSYSYNEMMTIIQKVMKRFIIPVIIPLPLFRLIAIMSEYTMKLFGMTPMLTLEKTRELEASWEIDVSKAERELQFVSEISFKEGAQATYDWYKQEGWL